MSVVTSNDIAGKLSEIFGYGDKRCTRIEIVIEPQSLITATLEFHVDEGTLTQVLKLGKWEPMDE